MPLTLEQLRRRRVWASRLARWTAMLFFVLGTFFYAIASDFVTFLLPVRTLSVAGLLISGILFLFQFFEARRTQGGVPVVTVTGLVLSFLLAGLIYTREFAAYREVEVSFENEGVTLSGTLYLPSEEGMYPAAVIAQGSIRAPRRLYHIWSDMLVRNDIAVLNFDKRGTGSSGGEYESENNSSEKNLTLLASDVAAGLRMVRGHPEIDSSAIGILGISMGGWLAPLAASEVPGIAYLVLISGPTVSVGEENYFSELTGEGHREGMELSADSLEQLLAQCAPSGFDPRGILQRLDVPSLWLFGAEDLSIPVPKSSAVLDTLIGRYERPYAYRIYDGANHLLVLPEWPFDFPGRLKDDIVSFIKTRAGQTVKAHRSTSR